jgi:hypothetical protein
MISGKRVLAPPTLIQKYPELRKIADAAEDSGDNLGASKQNLLFHQ